MKRNLILLYLLFQSVQCVYSNTILPNSKKFYPENAKRIQNHVYYEQKFNALYFNALQLSKEQAVEFEKITLKYDKIYKKDTNNLIKETDKYKTMKDNNIALSEQKQIIKDIYKILKKNSKSEQKELKSILNKQQLQKYKLLKHLEVQDIKKEVHNKNYYKSNPQMSTFGDLKK